MGGGGSSTPKNTTQTTTQQLDPMVKAWTQRNYDVATNIANTPYSPYTGEMVPALTGLQWQGIQQGAQAAGNGVGLGAINQGINAAGQVGQYQPQQVTTGWWNQQAAQQYMNPYTQSVIDATNQQIDRNLAQTQQQTNAQAAMAGAYGGSRQAVQNATNDYYANQLKAQTAAQLNDQAYNNAQSAFASDQSRGLQAQQANQQAGLNAANLGLGSADLLGRLGLSQQSAALGNAQALYGYGQNLQDQQAAIDQWNYQNLYQNPQNWPLRGLSALESAVSGIPYGSTSSTTSPYYQNKTAGLLGGAATGAGLGFAVSGGNPVGAAIGAGLGGILNFL